MQVVANLWDNDKAKVDSHLSIHLCLRHKHSTVWVVVCNVTRHYLSSHHETVSDETTRVHRKCDDNYYQTNYKVSDNVQRHATKSYYTHCGKATVHYLASRVVSSFSLRRLNQRCSQRYIAYSNTYQDCHVERASYQHYTFINTLFYLFYLLIKQQAVATFSATLLFINSMSFTFLIRTITHNDVNVTQGNVLDGHLPVSLLFV